MKTELEITLDAITTLDCSECSVVANLATAAVAQAPSLLHQQTLITLANIFRARELALIAEIDKEEPLFASALREHAAKNKTMFSVWCSYVKKGAPSNACGARTGYGKTKEDASIRAGHYANQQAWEGFKKVTVYDYDKISAITTQSEIIYWSLYPGDDCPGRTPAQLKAKELAYNYQFAQAILLLL